MKRGIAMLTAVVLVCSCNGDIYEHHGKIGSWSQASYATIEAITGDYSLVSASWSSPIDISGEGFVTDDILCQMQMYGWAGVQSIRYMDEDEPVSVLYRSSVLVPGSPDELTQINLYAPFPEGREDAEHPLQKMNRCNVDMFPYQFHYKVDSRGGVLLYGVDDRRLSGDGGSLTNVRIRIEGSCIYFEADTVLYDWSTSSWQEGHITLEYRHN